MIKLLILAGLIALVFHRVMGAWPWDYLSTASPRNRELARARRLLGVRANADAGEIRAAHRKLAAKMHPDRGGSTARIAAINTARDLLLANLNPR
ncbi:MAG: J domain-containing protein [Sphingomonadaceae bacterium]